MKYTILILITFSCFFINGQICHDLDGNIQFAFLEEVGSMQKEFADQEELINLLNESDVNINKLIRQSIKDITEIKEYIDWDKMNGDIKGWAADSYQVMLDDLLDNLQMIRKHKKTTFKN